MTSQTTFTSCLHDVMLESNQDDVKLEAMRCVTVMTAKGKLSLPRTLFPHIVKNVNSNNPELKKLIYLYLSNFADQEPDLALLPVASLQKSIKSPNPLVRSSALKVLTSTRLSILSAIFMATLRNSVNDLSPIVRKTVAHSIIKIYRLDPALKGDLMEYIERLFEDKNSTVLSSAVATFEVVCPERLDLIRKHFRRLCFILPDCNEWGQTIMVNLLTQSALDTYTRVKAGEDIGYIPAEHDLKILLRAAKPLVHSANSAVVMAVIKLYIALANINDVRSVVPRPLVRLLHCRREVQLLVLKMIDDLTTINLGEPIEQYDTGELDDDEQEDKPEDDDDDSGANHAEQKTHSVMLDNEEEADEEEAAVEKLTVVDLATDGAKQDKGEEEEEEEEESDDDEEEYEYEEVEIDEDEEFDEEEEDDEDDDEMEEEAMKTMQNGEQSTNGVGEHSSANLKNGELELVDFESNKDAKAFRELFRPYIKCFFVKYTDCTQIRLAKLRILTNLSCPVNVNQILRELQAYIAIYVEDRELISAAIQAMGRCAIIVKEVAHSCLNALTNLLSNNSEHIVSEAIVVLRSQIMNKKPARPEEKVSRVGGASSTNNDGPVEKSNLAVNSNEEEQPQHHFNATTEAVQDEDTKMVSTVIKQVTKLLPTVTAPQARATILWIIAEFCNQNRTAAKCAPYVLRMVAKSFCTEDNVVKLQALTLSSKFLLSLDKEKKVDLYQKIQLLTSYLFSLTKYDTNHDVRDRGRFLKKLLEEEEICSKVLNGMPRHQIALKS